MFILLIVSFLAILVPEEQHLNYILNISMILPFFIVMGYYLIRSAEDHSVLYRSICSCRIKKENNTETIKHYFSNCERDYNITLLNIILPYLILVYLFFVLKSDLKVNEDVQLRNMLLFLVIFVPVLGVIISRVWYNFLIKGTHTEDTKSKNAYLYYLIAGLLLSIILISILPTFGFLIFSNKEEVTMQAKSDQIHLANKIQVHRELINDRIEKAKFNIGLRSNKYSDEEHIKNMKFSPSFGLYLNDYILKTLEGSDKNAENFNDFSNSIIYKKITDYLFLPADHFDFYNNTSDYYWKLSSGRTINIDSLKKIDPAVNHDSLKSHDSLKLVFYNRTDTRDTSSFSLSAAIPVALPFLSNLDKNDKFFQILSLLVLLSGLSALIVSVTRRVFLIGYFEEGPGKDQDDSTLFLDEIFKKVRINKSDAAFWGTEKLNLAVIESKEKEYPIGSSDYAECILKIQTLLREAYEKIWNSCTVTEKSVLYDFALDGFTNYKNVHILYPLYKKRILKKENHHLVIMTYSLRNFLISKTASPEIIEIQKSVSEGGKWGNLSTVFYILLFTIIIFLFIVQEEISRQILAIVTSLGALIPLLLKLFNTSSNTKKTSE